MFIRNSRKVVLALMAVCFSAQAALDTSAHHTRIGQNVYRCHSLEAYAWPAVDYQKRNQWMSSCGKAVVVAVAITLMATVQTLIASHYFVRKK